jgi:hypothetical protein
MGCENAGCIELAQDNVYKVILYEHRVSPWSSIKDIS